MRTWGEEGKIANSLCEKDKSELEDVESEFFMFVINLYFPKIKFGLGCSTLRFGVGC